MATSSNRVRTPNCSRAMAPTSGSTTRSSSRRLPTSPEPPHYTFGDTDAAAARLDLVAEVFEPPSRRFLTEQARSIGRCRLAVDVGCGPGHSTQLLAELVGADRTIGLD